MAKAARKPPLGRRRWAEELHRLAGELALLSGHCPRCEPAEHVDCQLCRPVWHLAEALLAFAALSLQVPLNPEEPSQ